MALQFHAFGQNDISVIPNVGKPVSEEFVPGQVLVGLKNSDPNFDSQVKGNGGKVIDRIAPLNVLVVKVPVHTESAFIKAISNNPNVEFAEQDAVVTAFVDPTDDPYFVYQWGLQKIKAPSAWNIQSGLGSGVKVAVIDTGVDYTHVDLAGIVDTANDKDYVDGDNDVFPGTCSTNGVREWHGTFVSGIIAAIDNTAGIVGVSQVEILPIRVLNECGSGSTSNVAAGISYAASKDVDVINLSLGSSFKSRTLESAVNNAYNSGVVIVASAGNSGTAQKFYPASFKNAIAVSALDNSNNLASYSTYGKSIELSAPGGDGDAATSEWILSIIPSNSYAISIGTSFSAPHVSGVAALVKAEYPLATNVEIREHLQTTADDLGDSGRDNIYGYGLVNAYVAVNTLINSPEPEPDPDPTISIGDVTQAEGDSGTTNFDFTVTRSGDTTGSSSVSFETADGTATTADGDYISASGTVSFASGDTQQTVTVTVNGDTTVELDETFTVKLSNPTGATIADDQGLGTITNDDTSESLYTEINPSLKKKGPWNDISFTVYVTDGKNAVPNVSVQMEVKRPDGDGVKTFNFSGTTDDSGSVKFTIMKAFSEVCYTGTITNWSTFDPTGEQTDTAYVNADRTLTIC